MSLTDPEVLFLSLIFPTLFALTLIGDGFKKVMHCQSGGTFCMTVGVIFIALVVVAYFYFSTLKTS